MEISVISVEAFLATVTLSAELAVVSLRINERRLASLATPASSVPVTLPGPEETVSFAAHIKPLFREHDRQSMMRAFDLWSYDDVRAHAPAILDQLSKGTMPCDGAWPADQVEVFKRWTETGFQP